MSEVRRVALSLVDKLSRSTFIITSQLAAKRNCCYKMELLVTISNGDEVKTQFNIALDLISALFEFYASIDRSDKLVR